MQLFLIFATRHSALELWKLSTKVAWGAGGLLSPERAFEELGKSPLSALVLL